MINLVDALPRLGRTHPFAAKVVERLVQFVGKGDALISLHLASADLSQLRCRKVSKLQFEGQVLRKARIIARSTGELLRAANIGKAHLALKGPKLLQKLVLDAVPGTPGVLVT